jgi:hypothetical protein
VKRTLSFVFVCVTLLTACSSPQSPVQEGTSASASCSEDLSGASVEVAAQGLSVANAYASAMPKLAKLAFTGAIRAGTLIFKGMQNTPAFTDVPEDLAALTRPLERSFAEIRQETKLYIDSLEVVGEAARRCRRAARAADDLCLEDAATGVEKSVDAVVDLTRRRMAVKGGLDNVMGRIESLSLRIERASVSLTGALASVETCLARP